MSILDSLSKLSSAEQFLEALGVPYDPSVVNVYRLHILKRFNALLDLKALQGQPDAVAEAKCREALAAAYAEFAEGTGKKTFKVFQQATPGFVPLSALAPARG